MKFNLIIATYLLFANFSNAQKIYCPEIDSMAKATNSFFPFGVASGDPKVNSVVIWSALYDPSFNNEPVNWEVASDTNFTSILQKGNIIPKLDQGMVVKKTIDALPSGTKLFYRFKFKNQTSPIGRTKTAPKMPHLSNWQW